MAGFFRSKSLATRVMTDANPLHLCQDAMRTDTYHANEEEAMHQAEWDLGVLPEEWQTVQA